MHVALTISALFSKSVLRMSCLVFVLGWWSHEHTEEDACNPCYRSTVSPIYLVLIYFLVSYVQCYGISRDVLVRKNEHEVLSSQPQALFP